MSFSMFRVEYEIKHSNRNGQPITVEKDSKLERLLAKLANVSAGTAKKYFPGHVDYLTGFHDTEDEGRWMFSFIDRHGNIQHEEHVLDKEGFDKMTAELGQFRPNMGSARVWHEQQRQKDIEDEKRPKKEKEKGKPDEDTTSPSTAFVFGKDRLNKKSRWNYTIRLSDSTVHYIKTKEDREKYKTEIEAFNREELEGKQSRK